MRCYYFSKCPPLFFITALNLSATLPSMACNMFWGIFSQTLINFLIN